MEYEFWTVGDNGNKFPNLGKSSTARVMQALIKLGGRMKCAHAAGGSDFEDQYRGVEYIIELPVGIATRFEEMTGYSLSKPREVHLN
jgi:hypothetical protein